MTGVHLRTYQHDRAARTPSQWAGVMPRTMRDRAGAHFLRPMQGLRTPSKVIKAAIPTIESHPHWQLTAVYLPPALPIVSYNAPRRAEEAKTMRATCHSLRLRTEYALVCQQVCISGAFDPAHFCADQIAEMRRGSASILMRATDIGWCYRLRVESRAPARLLTVTVFNHTLSRQLLSIYPPNFRQLPSKSLFLISLFAIGTIAPPPIRDPFPRYKRAFLYPSYVFYFISVTSRLNSSGRSGRAPPLPTPSLLAQLFDTPTFRPPCQYAQEDIHLHTLCPKMFHLHTRDTHSLDG
ncbi:hypothetical protein BJV78DRAFT_467456 [Lactifluus subvellereus]|nr:hypothetical protein BJV78DRAFT_467456 [Lactifluus subvellereus]